MRFTITLAWAVLSLVAASVATSHWNGIFGMAVLIAMVGWFLVSSFENTIPAEPKLMNGILTVYGKPTGIVHGPGRHFLPFGPNIFSHILVDATKKKTEVKIEVQTPDGVTNCIEEVSVEFMFDPARSQEFLASGGWEAIMAQLDNLTTQSIRHWIESPDEGPQTWQEVKTARWEATNAILESLMGDGIPVIHRDIPSAVLLKYFDHPRKNPNAAEEKEWGKEWIVLKKKLEDMSQQEQAGIETRTRKRRSLIMEIMEGSAKLSKKEKGIFITTVTIGIIKPLEEVAKIAEKKVVAEINREAAQITLAADHDQAMARALEVKDFAETAKMPPESAAEYLLITRGTTKKTIDEKVLKTSPEIVTAFERMLKLIVERVLPDKRAPRKGRA